MKTPPSSFRVFRVLRGPSPERCLCPSSGAPAIFIVCGGACGMLSDPKMRRAVDTGRVAARNSFRCTVRRSFAVRVSSTGPASPLRRNEFRAPGRGVAPAPFLSFVAPPGVAWRLTRQSLTPFVPLAGQTFPSAAWGGFPASPGFGIGGWKAARTGSLERLPHAGAGAHLRRLWRHTPCQVICPASATVQ